jgi:uncharacterized protein (DUF58 family)
LSATTRSWAGSADRVTRPGSGARFIDPQILSRIGNLELLARIVVDGFISGLHRTFQLGVSTEFAEHRAYTPGVDIRRIDWRVYARTDRLYVKAYEAETNADLVLALDASGSMDFASGDGAVTKFDYARYLAASLAHLAERQRDRGALAVFDDRLRDFIPPTGRHRKRVLRALEAAAPGGGSDPGRALEQLGDALRRRAIVVVISDYYAAPDGAASALGDLRARGHDVIAIHVMDPQERDLEHRPLAGAQALQDIETGDSLPMPAAPQRAEYRRLVEEHIEALRRGCGTAGVDYACFDTSQSLDHVLFRYLTERARLSRVR